MPLPSAPGRRYPGAFPAQPQPSVPWFWAISNSFEAVGNGNSLTTANTASSVDAACSAVTIGTGTTLQGSTAFAAHGSTSMAAQVGSTVTAVYAQWTFPLSSVTNFRFYVYLTAAPVADDTVIQWNNNGSRSSLFAITATGPHWTYQDNAFNESGFTMTATIPFNQWTRLDGFIIWGAGSTGTLTWNYYAAYDAVTPTETHTFTGTVNTGPAPNQVLVGWPSGGHASQPLTYWDDIAVSSAAIAPVGSATVTLTPGLATATGSAGQPAVAITAGLATATGASAQPAVAVTTVLATAPGTALQPAIAILTGLATGTGAANAPPAIAVTPGLATGAGTSQSPAAGITDGLATSTGTAFAPTIASPGIPAGLASGTGAAAQPAVGITAGLATAAGSAGQPAVGITDGLATGAGHAAQPAVGITGGLAAALGTVASPAVGITGGLATGAGTSQSPPDARVPGLPSASGAAGQPAIEITAGLATGTGSAGGPSDARSAGLPTGAGAAAQPAVGITGGLAAGTGTSQPPAVQTPVRSPENLGASLAYVNNGGTAITTANTYGGSLTLPNYGGGVTPVTIDAVCTPVTIDGAAASLANTYGGTLALADYDAATIGWTMQQVALTLAENNDETVSVAITQNGSPLNLTSATVNMYLKTAAGAPDGGALLLSSGGGSPAITITNPSGGLCSVAIPRADLTAETNTFYRIDVVFSGLQNTAIYGAINWVTL